jgi:hypothetical protein
MVLKMQHGGFAGGSGLGGLLQPSPPSTFPIGGGGGDLASVNLLEYAGPGGGSIGKPFIPPTAISGPGTITDPNLFPQPIGKPGPIFNLPGPGLQLPIFGGLQPMPQPDYSSQFDKFGETLGGFGEQLGGFGEQMTGYQDALGSFNEQVGGMGKQFETISNRLDSVDKGLGSLGNQIASLENMQKAQPQEVMPQQQQQSYNPFSSPFGFGGLGSLFGGYF